MVNVKRILIVGAGIAGLSLATALQKQNFVVEVVERSPTWSITGAGITLPANGVRVLRALGLGDAVERDGAIIRQWGFFGQQGELLCNTDLEALWGDVGPCLCIARPRLHQALLGDASAVPIRLGTSVTSLLQNSESVSVGFSNGSSGEYDLVVGADGVHSTIRSLAISPVPPIYAGQLIWRSITPTCPQGLTNMMVFLGNQRSFFGLLPLGNGSAYGFGCVYDEMGFDDPMEGRLERFRTRFAGFGGLVPEYVASLTHDRQFHFGPTERVELEQWRNGRILLIGDAAHASQPMMAEGGCMAMEDALVLAEVLSLEDTLEGALNTYVSRRKPRTEWVQQQSQAVAEAITLPPASRNATLRERGDQLMWQRYKLLRPMP
jgi:2-polyprenyl-6-methoxyphenol hydroxylase-like FAD-dependent oxidoreductase